MIVTYDDNSIFNAGNIKGINTNTITFNTNGGNKIESQTILNGNIVEKPVDPIKEGYEFSHWEINGEVVSFYNFVSTKSLTLEAVYVELIKEVDFLSAHINIKDTYHLPKKVSATNLNGDKTTVNVSWDTNVFKANSKGEYIVSGTVEGYDSYILVYIHVTDSEENIVSGYVHGLESEYANIYLTSNGNVLYEQTNSNGYFEFDNLSDDTYVLKIEKDGFYTSEPEIIVFDSNYQTFSLNNNNIYHVDKYAEKITHDGYYYEWYFSGDVFGYETSVNVVEPFEVEFLNEKIEINNSNASMYLESKYNQLLVDGDIEWTTEFATRLYETFNKLPNIDNGKTLWKLTDKFILDDITITNHSTYNEVLISTSAFKNATPMLATLDGQKGTFYSNRLYHALVHYLTDGGNDLNKVDKIF